MKLPDNSIGITDLLAYRECARRMSYGMRRHVGVSKQTDDATPEKVESAAAPAAAYGSAVHEAIALSEDGFADEDAVSRAWAKHGSLLYPEDLERLTGDLALYHERDFPGTRTMLSEDEIRVPLFLHEGEQIYFRAKIDRLYQNLNDPSTFIHLDFKTSKWPKSEQEVHDDLQMWAYNMAIHHHLPECENLIQVYDQLRYGQIQTRKSESQRASIRRWIEEQTRAVLADEDYQADGLLKPSFNEWCPWCPILTDCPIISQLGDYATTRIDALNEGVESSRLSEYVQELAKAKRASQTLDRFDKTVRKLLKELPTEEREALGYTLRSRTNSVFGPRAKREMYETLGDRFFRVANVTQEALKRELSEPEILDGLLEMAERVEGTSSVVKKRGSS